MIYGTISSSITDISQISTTIVGDDFEYFEAFETAMKTPTNSGAPIDPENACPF